MELTSTSLADGARIPEYIAMGKSDPDSHATFAGNVSPHLAWSGAPEGTRSFAVVLHDIDVPWTSEIVNTEGTEIPADFPRGDFFHWVLVDLAPSVTELAEGAHSSGVVKGGKPGPAAPGGGRHGINSYREFFAGSDLAGDYFGYDGPFPPWNDAKPHQYFLTVYALDVDTLDLPDPFTGPQALAALAGHVLASAHLTATYSTSS